jgi:hypothetical protein
MNTWFETNVKYVKIDENGRERKVSETYLLDAINFTEAETRIHTELQKMISGEFQVKKISDAHLSEIIPCSDGDRWYKSKVTFITIDEELGREKRVAQYVLVYAANIKHAYDNILEVMKGMMADFEITSIAESNILDVFPYAKEN